MSNKDFSFEVPTSLDQIKLSQYQRYVKLVTEHKDDANDEFLKIKLLEIFGGITNQQALQLAAADTDAIIEMILTAINVKEPPLQRRFTMTDPSGKKVEFGFIPNLERISLGEFIDAEAYVGDWEQMHRAMAVLYRPLTGHKGEFYEIEPYESSEKYSEAMLDAPASIAIGVMVFFYHLGMTLHSVTLHSLVQQVKEESKDLPQAKMPSSKSGDGINHYTHLLEGMYSELAKLQNELYTNAFSGWNLKKKKVS